MRRYLVVANQTLVTKQLEDKLGECLAAGPCRFHVLVPATHARDHLVWTEGHDRTIASQRLTEALARLWELGAEVDGEVGDASPFEAIADVLRRHEQYDEIIISTHPPGISRWLRQDLVHRAMRSFDVPVSHVVVDVAATAVGSNR
jgi:hypothetical protein